MFLAQELLAPRSGYSFSIPTPCLFCVFLCVGISRLEKIFVVVLFYTVNHILVLYSFLMMILWALTMFLVRDSQYYNCFVSWYLLLLICVDLKRDKMLLLVIKQTLLRSRLSCVLRWRLVYVHKVHSGPRRTTAGHRHGVNGSMACNGGQFFHCSLAHSAPLCAEYYFILYLMVLILWYEDFARCVCAMMMTCSGSNNTGAAVPWMVTVDEILCYYYVFYPCFSFSSIVRLSVKYKFHYAKLQLILSSTIISKHIHVYTFITPILGTIYLLTCYIMIRVLSFHHMAFSLDSNR